MSKDPHIKQLLQKFILNQCDKNELDAVVHYYRQNSLTEDMPTVDYVKELLGTMPQMDETSANNVFSNITAIIKDTTTIRLQNKRAVYKKYISIAAAVAVLLTIGITYTLGVYSPDNNMPILSGNEITLELENGEIQVLTESGEIVLTNAEGKIVGTKKGAGITYNTTTAGAGELVYNTLKIPNGKSFRLQLSDGTLVHLNSGTSLKYPVNFIKGLSRKVFLNGEAFFDVAKDARHPFIVNADNLNVRVLGTHFNVTNYPEDDYTDVVLVEGSVAMHNAGQHFDAAKSSILSPGYKGSFNKAENTISTKPVTTAIYTSWISGELVFRNMSFKNIIKKLERRYDVTITNYNEKLANEKFNASFKNEPIEKVLSYFNDLHGISYTKNKKHIIIK